MYNKYVLIFPTPGRFYVDTVFIRSSRSLRLRLPLSSALGLPPPLPNLHICLLRKQRLRPRLLDKQILHLDPFLSALVPQLHMPHLPLRLALDTVVPDLDGLERDVGHEVVPYGLAGRVQGRIWLDVGRHVETARREGDDRWVALGDELILAETFDVEEQVW